MMEREGDEQVQYLEQYLGALIIIIGVEPMLGFLGTIIGLIRAFMAWELLGSNITVSALASGIYQAMITTAAGLIVAIPKDAFLADAKAVQLSALGRLYLRARKAAAK